MRVGIDISALGRYPSGVGCYTRHLVQHLLPLLTGSEVRCLSTGMQRVQIDQFQVQHHRHLPIPTRALYQLWRHARWPKVESLLGPIDLYHATNYFLPPTRRARRALTIYDLSFLRVPHLCSPKIVGPFSRLVEQFAREADVILTCSEATKRDIIDLLGVTPEKIFVAYGAAEAYFSPLPKEAAQAWVLDQHKIQSPYLLFVSTLEPRKNVEGLLRAFKLLEQEIPHTLVLIGREGWNDRPTHSLITELGLEGRVRHLGYLEEHQDLVHFYAGADAFVFPSHFEGFGLPVLEAMSCGCPVITAANSSLPEVAGEAAIYVDPASAKDIAEGVRAVLEDTEGRQQRVALGLDRSRTFTWDRCARITLEAYQAALGESP